MGPRIAALIAVLTLAACKDDPRPLIDAAVVTADSDTSIDAPDNATCGGGSVGYLGVCTDNAQCGGGCVCNNFGHTQICTLACTTGGEPCPSPSAGCSSGGFCRP